MDSSQAYRAAGANPILGERGNERASQAARPRNHHWICADVASVMSGQRRLPGRGTCRQFYAMSDELLDRSDVSLFADLVNRLRNGTLPDVTAPEVLISGLEDVLRRAKKEVSSSHRQAFTREEAEALIRLGQQLLGGAVVTKSPESRSLYADLGSGTQQVGYALMARQSGPAMTTPTSGPDQSQRPSGLLTTPYFQHLEHALKAQAAASGLLSSTTGRGRAREHLLATFFQNHVPPRLLVARGEIVDSHGLSSGETDLIFADTHSPAFGVAGEAVIPVEAAVGACEVKSSLAGENLKDAVEKITRIKRLTRVEGLGFLRRSGSRIPRIPIPPKQSAGYVIAFEGPSLDTIIENLKNNPAWFDHDVMNYGPDVICMLEAGMIVKNDFHIFEGPPTLGSSDYFILKDAVGLQKLLGHVNTLLARYGQLTYEVIQYYMH